MRVIIDSNSLQARAHLQDSRRLATFLDVIRALPGGEVAFSPPGPLTETLLAGYDVLVIATRKGQKSQAQKARHWHSFLKSPATRLRRWLAKRKPNSSGDVSDLSLPACPYSVTELDAISDFVRRGGGLLLLSNHGDAPRLSPYDMTQNDAILARRFGIEIENAFFANPDPNILSEISGPDLLATHPIIRGAAGEAPVHSVITNNCCSIVSANGVPLIRLTHRMVDHRNRLSFQDRCFAVALESTAQVGNGRAVVAADSGFIGTEGTTFPGAGLIEQDDNSRLAQNMLRWLGRAL